MPKSNLDGGVVAAGHKATAEAACSILREGGNAFDATVAAMLAACVAEPVLASPGGGGFLTARPAGREPLVLDFFAQTPQAKLSPESVDIRPIQADFGTTTQTFHIGMGSIATPGFIRGLFAIHSRLCRMPLQVLIQPAVTLAREGVVMNAFQHLISRIIAPILLDSPASLALHCSPAQPDQLIQEGELHRQPQLADFLDALLQEGAALFYAGEVGARLSAACRQHGGHLQRDDLHDYQVELRRPLSHGYRGVKIFSNPLPALGGTLIGFTLGLLQEGMPKDAVAGDLAHLRSLARGMRLTQQLRLASFDGREYHLDQSQISAFRKQLQQGGINSRGTTQISIADRRGNLASTTLSNGEGCGYVIPGTGFMMNNMLGEEDLNPGGLNHWPQNRRLASMMTPTLLLQTDGRSIVTGSGGSNRIRSAILQVISNLIDFDMPLETAVSFPRVHFEDELLSLEPEQKPEVIEALTKEFPQQQYWAQKNLFFGGAHTVSADSGGQLAGAGDSRRGGVAMIV